MRKAPKVMPSTAGRTRVWPAQPREGAAAVSAAAPSLAPYSGAGQEHRLWCESQLAHCPDLPGPQSRHLANGFVTPMPGIKLWLLGLAGERAKPDL